MSSSRKLRVAIECRIPDVRQGIGTAMLSLAGALSRLQTEEQEYTFLITEDMRNWIMPQISGTAKLLVAPQPRTPDWKGRLRQMPWIVKLVRTLRGNRVIIPGSDGLLESGGFDVVHFPTQIAYRTAVPSIYQPWDLQHLHYPEYFTPEVIGFREAYYRTYCAQADVVCVAAEWTKADLVERYGLPPDKIAVIPWGPNFEGDEPLTQTELDSARTKLQLPEHFFFYPAASWPHKNHAVLLRALSAAASSGKRLHLCLTGAKTDAWPALEKMATELGVADRVHHYGFVSPRELQAIYASALAVVFASRFEGFGLPLLETFHAGVPLLCANATVLPETAGDGAAYFDPDDADALARLMMRAADDEGFRRDLIAKGKAVLARFSMERTAAMFHALYARVAAAHAKGDS